MCQHNHAIILKLNLAFNVIKRTAFFKCEFHTDDKAVEEKNEDTGSLTYWASKILNTACPQQKVSEEQCVCIGLMR